MNEIFTRRSVRQFTDRPVSDADLQQLLKAAMRAPSAMNQQSWEFVTVRNRQTMQGILDFHPHAFPVHTANCLIVVCANLALRKVQSDAWVLDCAAATQNILLEAVHLELGAVWLGIYPYPERISGLQSLLGLPEDVIPLSAVALGYPQQVPEPIDTFLQERVHSEQW